MRAQKMMTQEEWGAGITRLSADTDIEINVICSLARILAQSEFDPLPLIEWCANHNDWSRECIFPDDDFATVISNVPEPNSNFDYFVAVREFQEDVRNVQYAFKRGVSYEQAVVIALNQRAWIKLWAGRHPSKSARTLFQAALSEISELWEVTRRKAELFLARQVKRSPLEDIK
jgi:hypothetical protein